MYDQLTIGEKASYDDYGASLSERKIGQPKKKSVKETVPYSNQTYDFSKINGELYWEERELEYNFEMTANTPAELEEMKTAFSDWVMNVMEDNIYDPFIDDFHFIGTFEDIDFADEETLDKTTATVKFKAYPYKVGNLAKKYAFTVSAGGTVTATLINASSHRVTPLIKSSAEILIKRTTASAVESWGVGASTVAGELKDLTTGNVFMLEKGLTSLTLQNSGAGACTVEFSFIEEVL